MSAQFPVRPEEFEKSFIEKVFNQAPGALAKVSFEPVGTGQVCDSYRFTCDWADGADKEGRPATFIAKCPSADPMSRGAAAMFHLYDMEIGWYRDIAHQSGVDAPKSYHADISEDKQQFVLMLEDMAPAEQGDQLAGASVGQVAGALEEAAALHSFQPKQGDFDQYSWLLHSQGNSDFLRQNLPQIYPQFRERFTDMLSPEILDLGAALIARFDDYSDHQPMELCVTHGDLRLDNMLFEPGYDTPTLVDWQTCSLGNPANDVAYLVGTSFADPESRRREEEQLVKDYLYRRKEEWGMPFNFDSFWIAYRRHAFSGLLMAINASIYVERTERGDAMFAAMARRPAQMALDLDSLSLV